MFWLSVDLMDHEEVEIYQRELYDEVIFGAATEPMQAILDEGWEWEPGRRDTGKRFPIFTRAIKRQKPPKEPAGLASTDETGKPDSAGGNITSGTPLYIWGILHDHQGRRRSTASECKLKKRATQGVQEKPHPGFAQEAA